MKLSLFINPEHRVGDPLDERLSEHVQQAQAARSLGYDGIYIGHHLSFSGSVWLPPFETLARLAPECPGLHLGTCMLLLPLMDPAHVAQQAAALDIMSGGKLRLGVAPGWQRDEFETVQVAHERRFGRFQEALEALKAFWTGEPYSAKGRHFSYEEKTLALRPLQRPRPPLWLGGSVDSAIERAARNADTSLGDSWVASSHLTLEVVRKQARIFRDTLESLGKPLPGDFPVLRNIVVAPDERTAVREAGRALAESYQLFDKWGLFDEVIGSTQGAIELSERLSERVIIGSPNQCADTLAELTAASGTNHIIARVQWLGLEQRVVMRSIELMAERVLPQLMT